MLFTNAFCRIRSNARCALIMMYLEAGEAVARAADFLEGDVANEAFSEVKPSKGLEGKASGEKALDKTVL